MSVLELEELLDDGLLVRRLRVNPEDVVFVKGIFEASEGLCAMYAQRGGDLTIVAPVSRALELDLVLNDLARELHGVLDETP
ncbi:MAG: DUF4911 domain-containing protein [Pseudomonadota bacterium]